MDYSQAQELIRRHVQKLNIYALHNSFLKHTFTSDKVAVRGLFPDLSEHNFEALIQQLWEDRVILKDDGYTLTFEEAFSRADFDRYF